MFGMPLGAKSLRGPSGAAESLIGQGFEQRTSNNEFFIACTFIFYAYICSRFVEKRG